MRIRRLGPCHRSPARTGLRCRRSVELPPPWQWCLHGASAMEPEPCYVVRSPGQHAASSQSGATVSPQPACDARTSPSPERLDDPAVPTSVDGGVGAWRAEALLSIPWPDTGIFLRLEREISGYSAALVMRGRRLIEKATRARLGRARAATTPWQHGRGGRRYIAAAAQPERSAPPTVEATVQPRAMPSGGLAAPRRAASMASSTHR